MWLFGAKKKKLLEWQNKLLNEPVSKLIMTERQLKEQTQLRTQNDLRIANDCIALLNTTVKPEVFFSRLELLEEKSKDIVRFEEYVSFSGATPSEVLAEVYHDKPLAVHNFLVRYFASVLDKMDTLKTERGKKNQIQKFFDSLQPYYSVMSKESISYIEEKYHAYMK